jgi:hypothetical protein
MSNSATNLDLIQQSQAQKEVTANALFDAMSPSSFGGRRALTCSGLVFGIFGGRYIDNNVRKTLPNSTVTLQPNSVNYIEFDPLLGAVVSNISAYDPTLVSLYKVTTGPITVLSYIDDRVYNPTAFSSGSGGGSGTVTSVNLSMPSQFTVTNNPVTNSGTINVAWGSGLIPLSNLASGTANSTKFLRGDGTWAIPSGGGGGSSILYLAEDTTTLTTSPVVASNTKSWAIFENAEIKTGADQSIALGNSQNAGKRSFAAHIGVNTGFGIIDSNVEQSFVWGTNSSIEGVSNNSFAFGSTVNIDSSISSFVFGGNNNKAFHSQNVAILGGYFNTIGYSNSSCVIGGHNNNAGQQDSVVLGGRFNYCGSYRSTILGGNNNLTDSYDSLAHGSWAQTKKLGERAFSNGKFQVRGDAQACESVMRIWTGSTAPHELFLDGSGEWFLIANGFHYAFEILILATKNSNGDTAAWKAVGSIKNVGGTVSIVGIPSIVSLGADSASASWTINVSANNLYKKLDIIITADADVQCVAHVKTVEIGR